MQFRNQKPSGISLDCQGRVNDHSIPKSPEWRNAMTASVLSLAQARAAAQAPALPGTWKLAAGRAITLQPLENGVLRVAHGVMWATADGPHDGPPNDQGD